MAFSHEVDASLLNETTLRLEIVAADGAPSVALSARLAEGNPSVVLLTPQRALGPGDYRLILRGSGGGLADVNAQSLDVDYRSEFTVQGAP
ncbi:MAG: hypothetical protein E6K37_04350 [Gammaproteobacteria bacterium]|nr:MAG: hypothetical protein E6K37_04350 [Gammaproteobacteria bacterium]